MITNTDTDNPLLNAVAYAIAVEQRKDPYLATEPTAGDVTAARPWAQAALNAVVNYQSAETSDTTDNEEILDPELVAIALVVDALEPLDAAQRTRVITYLTDRYLPAEHTTENPAADNGSQQLREPAEHARA